MALSSTPTDDFQSHPQHQAAAETTAVSGVTSVNTWVRTGNAPIVGCELSEGGVPQLNQVTSPNSPPEDFRDNNHVYPQP